MPSILKRAESVPWLSAVGSPLSSVDPIYQPSLAEWRRFVSGAVAQEFGLIDSHESTLIDDIEWLDEDGPNPNLELSQRLPHLMKDPVLREQRLSISRTVLRGLRAIRPSPWLVVGGTDFREAIRKAAPWSFRMALAEEHGNCAGFWHNIVRWFELGFWPAGIIGDSRLVVL